MATVKYTGSVASFHCPTNADIRSLKVHFSPKQLGEGDPSPENVREIVGWEGVEVQQSGENLLNKNNTGYYSWDTGVFNNTNNYIHWRIPVKEGDKIYYKGSGPGVGCYFDKNGNCFGKIASSPAIVPAGAVEATNNFIQEAATNGIVKLNEPVSSYVQYQGSTTDYEFGTLGKNKLSDNIGDYDFLTASHSTYSYSLSNGEFSATVPNGVRDHLVILGKEQYMPGTYTLSLDYLNGGNNFHWQPVIVQYTNSWYGSRVMVEATDTSGHIEKTFTCNEPFSINLCLNSFGNTVQEGLNKIYNLQLELSSTATAYEPYDPKHTVYGGWVDLISGEVCEEWKSFDLTALTLTQFGVGQSVLTISAFPGAIKSRNAMFCNFLPPVPNPNISGVEGVDWNNSRMNMCLSVNRGLDTQAKVEQWLTDMKTGGTTPTIVADMVTPNTYHLAQIQLQTFLGQNNVWSNADYVEVEYDLHETEDILRRKQFIIANQPHIETLAPAPLQSFNTDVVAPLKECKVYFEPVQEGEGTPSPNNVMAITGWNEMTISQSQGQVVQDATNEDWTVGWLTAGGILNASSSYRTSDYIPMLSGTTVRIKFTNQTSERTWYCIACYDSQKKFLARNNQGYTTEDITCTVSYEGLKYIRISINRASDVLISIGPITTDLIDWSSTTGTIYGGYIDLLTGEVWGTYHKVILDGENVKANRPYYSNNYYGAGWVYTNPSGQPARYSNRMPTNIWCENVPVYIGLSAVPEPPYIYAPLAGALYLVVYLVKAEDHPELDDSTARINYVNEWLKENPISVVYELATPVLLTTLTPAQIKTLKGRNNIWSNANGDISIKYWKH